MGSDNLHMVFCCGGFTIPERCPGTDPCLAPEAWLGTFTDCGGDTETNSSTGCGCCSVFSWASLTLAGCGDCITTAEFSPTLNMQPRCSGTGSTSPPAAPMVMASRPELINELAPADGPGTELTFILESLGIKSDGTCGCMSMAKQMNRWGVDGCKKNRKTIVDFLKTKQTTVKWKRILKAVPLAVWNGMTFINPRDIAGSLVDEAVKRVEQR